MGWESVTRLVEVEQPAEEADEVNAGADGRTAIFPSSVQLVHERPGGCRSVRPDDGGLVSESFSGKAKTLRRPGSDYARRCGDFLADSSQVVGGLPERDPTSVSIPTD